MIGIRITRRTPCTMSATFTPTLVPVDVDRVTAGSVSPSAGTVSGNTIGVAMNGSGLRATKDPGFCAVLGRGISEGSGVEELARGVVGLGLSNPGGGGTAEDTVLAKEAGTVGSGEDGDGGANVCLPIGETDVVLVSQ